MDQSATPFSGWAIVEQMGHKTIVGHVSEQLVAGVPLLRIDVPGDGDVPKATQFIHASTLYALTPTTEAIARKVAARTYTAPAAYLPAGRDVDFDDIDDVDDREDDEPEEREDISEACLGLAGNIVQDFTETRSDVPEMPKVDQIARVADEIEKLVRQFAAPAVTSEA